MKAPVLVLLRPGDRALSTLEQDVLRTGQEIAIAMNEPIVAAVYADSESGIVQSLQEYALDTILCLKNDNITSCDIQSLSGILEDYLNQHPVSCILACADDLMSDILSYLSIKTSADILVNAAGVSIEKKKLVIKRPAYDGKRNLQYTISGEHAVYVTLNRGSDAGSSCEKSSIVPDVKEWHAKQSDQKDNLRLEIEPIIQKKQKKESIIEAEGIVAAGQGVRGQEGIDLLAELADLLGASLGASRPIVDEGLIPKEQQIGLSGQIVAPEYYIACGISGANQHVIGMEKSKWVMALNYDRNAPIFDYADIGVIGDAQAVIRELIKKIKRYREQMEEDRRNTPC